MTDTTSTAIKYVPSYDLWRNLLRRSLQPGDYSDGEVHLGYFRFRTKNHDNGGDAIALWEASPNVIAASVNGKEVQDHYNVFDGKGEKRTSLPELFQWCLKRPVTEDAYWKRIDSGNWGDLNEAVSDQIEGEREQLGGNKPPSDDPFERLKDQIDAMAAEVKKVLAAGPAKTKDEADQAGDLAERLGKLHGQADKAREVEKAPHWQKCQEIQEKWKPLIAAAEIYKKVKAAVITPWQIEAERQRQAQIAAQRAEADRLAQQAADAQRRADEEAQRLADEAARGNHTEDQQQGSSSLVEAAGEADRLKKAAEAAQKTADQTAKDTVKVGGSRGRSISLRPVLVLEVVDRRAAASALKDRPGFLGELDELLLKHARPLIQAGQQVPGVESKTEMQSV